MIGSVLLDGEPLVTLDDAGQWIAANPDAAELAASLNVTDDPHLSEVGDHHLPFGVAALNRVSARLNGRVVLARPVEPLPAGATS